LLVFRFHILPLTDKILVSHLFLVLFFIYYFLSSLSFICQVSCFYIFKQISVVSLLKGYINEGFIVNKSILKKFESRECMIQPFMQSVVDEGEYSLIYFDSVLSHTILKTVEKGDFRVQEEHGGGVTPIINPNEELLKTAEKVMSTLPEKPLYARVDLVRTPQNSFALMELELIEPSLYFRFDSTSPKVFAQTIDATYMSKRSS
jgi:hypothetical protein